MAVLNVTFDIARADPSRLFAFVLLMGNLDQVYIPGLAGD
jgi:hypothetical protein